MHSRMSARAALSLLLLLTATSAAWSQQTNSIDPMFAQAIKAYSAKQYSQALNGFVQVSKKYPANISSHYYMGLCYQGLNQTSQAQQQYQWVSMYSHDPILVAQSKSALAQIDRLKNSNTALATRNTSVVSQTTNQTAVAASKPQFSGRLKVYEFYTNWCHVCKDFEPSWDRVSSNSKYRNKVDFLHLDAEDSSNAALKQQYQVDRYPTFVFTDGSGRVLQKYAGHHGEAGLISDIQQFIGP